MGDIVRYSTGPGFAFCFNTRDTRPWPSLNKRYNKQFAHVEQHLELVYRGG